MLEMVRGFTLIELIIVVVVLGILAAIAIVGYGAITKDAEESAAQANLAAFTKTIRAHHTKTGAPELTRELVLEALAHTAPGVVDGGIEAEGAWELFGKDYLVSGPEEFAIGFAVTPGGEVNNVAGKYAVLTTSTGTKTYAHSINHHGAAAWEGVTGQVETSSTPADLLEAEAPTPPEPQEPAPTGPEHQGTFLLDTNASSCSRNQEVYVPVHGEVDATIDWGDGTPESVITELPPAHTYAEPGEYEVTITGTFTRLGYSDTNNEPARTFNPECIIEFSHWGEDLGVTEAIYAFFRASNLQYVDTPPEGALTSTRGMFKDASSYNQNIDHWDVSKVTTMTNMFHSARRFNQPLNSWDVESVTGMSGMFQNAQAFDQPLDEWTTSSLKKMSRMFSYATNFNGDISTWDIRQVEDAGAMFESASSFNQNIGGWEPTRLYLIKDMFRDATQFNQDLSSWEFVQNKALRSPAWADDWNHNTAQEFETSPELWPAELRP